MSEENKVNSVEKIPEDEYRTDQTPIAAYLITEGFELIHIDFTDKRFVSFYFRNDTLQLKDAVRDFETFKARVDPAIYIRNYQDLIKSIKRGY